ncbi:MAG: hypothetical protein ACN4GF_05395 [Lentimonas sp.]
MPTIRIPRLLVLCVFCLYNTANAEIWTKRVLDTVQVNLDDNGFPIADELGNISPNLTTNYTPSAFATEDGFDVLLTEPSRFSDPPLLTPDGFPVVGDYARLALVKFTSRFWAQNAPFNSWESDLTASQYADRQDGETSACDFNTDGTVIRTFATPNDQQITLPVEASSGSVVINSDGGIHILWINPTGEL